ncbi:4628_t:CDS:10 [Ambispora leptoticha]|uniref:4628_t:CDS:1 n=1 Tax=Ambispora leptoticha TaxID=144679 RepID=A0A9N9A0J0_9GLOM|nr:4628_t:CDS:10 [Ambispora leptoticha]
MHDAFKVSVALDKFQHKIESIFAYGDKLLVGTQTGALSVYEVHDPIGDEPLAVTLTETFKNFARSKIDQLDIIKEIGVLVSLADSHVSIFDLNTFQLQRQLTKTRGANIFSIDTKIEISEDEGSKGIPMIVTRLAVGVRRKLIIFTWKDSDFTDTKEFPIADRIRAMAWVSPQKLCLGLSNEYALIDITSGNTIDLFSPSSVTSSGTSYISFIGTKVNKPLVTKLPHEEILLAKDNVSIFVGLDGNPTRKVGIDWSGMPEEIGYSYPYLIAILPKHVEVRNLATQTLVQTVELPQARLINAGKYLYIANNSTVWRFIPYSYEKQIDQLVEQLEYEEAISLTKQIEPILLDDKDAKLKQIRNLFAHHLFRQQKFDTAITIFQELETDPAEVIALYPPSISGESDSEGDQESIEKLTEKPLENGTKSHQLSVVKELGSITGDDSQNITSIKDEKLSEAETVVKETEKNENKLEGKVLEEAVSALIRFLTDRRQKTSKILHHLQSNRSVSSTPPGSPSSHRPSLNSLSSLDMHQIMKTAALVDTSLLKSYMIINDALVGPLLRVPNHCNVEESEGLLLERKKYKELVDLYHGKGLHRKSLELLKMLGQSSEGPMKGTLHTILYLQKLGPDHFDLILEFASWVLETDPEEGMEIFIDDHLEVQKLPRDQVLKYLEQFSPDLCIIFLEHIIYGLGDQTSEYHNRLIMAYLNKLRRLNHEIEVNGSSEKIQKSLEETDKKLLNFLDESQFYRAEKILGQLRFDDFFAARAKLLSRLGQHDQALHIYVHKLKDEQMAEEYCIKKYNDKNNPVKKVFLSLLRVYLKPSDGEEVMIEPALRLLSRHGTHVNASEALEMLPPTIKVSQLYGFVEKYIRESNRNRNMNMIVKNLLKADQSQQLMFYRSRRVKIDEDRMCPQCTRRIGHSVFAVFPNGVIVHYHCKDKYSASHETTI